MNLSEKCKVGSIMFMDVFPVEGVKLRHKWFFYIDINAKITSILRTSQGFEMPIVELYQSIHPFIHPTMCIPAGLWGESTYLYLKKYLKIFKHGYFH